MIEQIVLKVKELGEGIDIKQIKNHLKKPIEELIKKYSNLKNIDKVY